jgi:hypothetical protein
MLHLVSPVFTGPFLFAAAMSPGSEAATATETIRAFRAAPTPATTERYDSFAYECKLILHAYASRWTDASFLPFNQQ